MNKHGFGRLGRFCARGAEWPGSQTPPWRGGGQPIQDSWPKDPHMQAETRIGREIRRGARWRGCRARQGGGENAWRGRSCAARPWCPGMATGWRCPRGTATTGEGAAGSSPPARRRWPGPPPSRTQGRSRARSCTGAQEGPPRGCAKCPARGRAVGSTRWRPGVLRRPARGRGTCCGRRRGSQTRGGSTARRGGTRLPCDSSRAPAARRRAGAQAPASEESTGRKRRPAARTSKLPWSECVDHGVRITGQGSKTRNVGERSS